jgi:hypothetical protein
LSLLRDTAVLISRGLDVAFIERIVAMIFPAWRVLPVFLGKDLVKDVSTSALALAFLLLKLALDVFFVHLPALPVFLLLSSFSLGRVELVNGEVILVFRTLEVLSSCRLFPCIFQAKSAVECLVDVVALGI